MHIEAEQPILPLKSERDLHRGIDMWRPVSLHSSPCPQYLPHHKTSHTSITAWAHSRLLSSFVYCKAWNRRPGQKWRLESAERSKLTHMQACDQVPPLLFGASAREAVPCLRSRGWFLFIDTKGLRDSRLLETPWGRSKRLQSCIVSLCSIHITYMLRLRRFWSFSRENGSDTVSMLAVFLSGLFRLSFCTLKLYRYSQPDGLILVRYHNMTDMAWCKSSPGRLALHDLLSTNNASNHLKQDLRPSITAVSDYGSISWE